MSLALSIKIKVVLLMGNFQSLTTVKRKLQAEFGKQTPSLNCIKNALLKLEQWKIENVRKGLRLLQKRQSKKFVMFVKLNEGKVFEE